MKTKSTLCAILPLLISLTSCCQTSSCPCASEVVCETHLHRYGVPLNCDDWNQRGQNGQVISTLKNGVVATKNYDQGVLNGDTTYTYPHRDTIQRKEVYDHGALIEVTEYYPTGIPFRQQFHRSPISYSVVQWYENGVPQCRESYEDDRLITGEYYTPANLIESRVDDQEGFRVLRDGQGYLLSNDTIKKGAMVTRTTYHPNESPAAVTPYFQGKIEGKRTTYTPSGEPLTIESWKNDLQEGNTVVFEFGEKVADVPYVKGRRQGIERCYRDNGETLVKEVNWVKGVRHGKCKTYIGRITTEDWYFQNELVNKPTYDMLCNQ